MFKNLLKLPFYYLRKFFIWCWQCKYALYLKSLPGLEKTSDKIKEALCSPKPVMIARFGSVELDCVVGLTNNSKIKQYWRYFSGQTGTLGPDESTINRMFTFFFPKKIELLERFAQLMLKAMPEVDILGAWCREEDFFKPLLKQAYFVRLGYLEPFFVKNEPWTKALDGKKVLVINPFSESIKSQYAKRKLLFKNPDILPDFELQTLKSVFQSEPNEQFETWFDALEYMQAEIRKRDFDIAIIGCGPYGFLLAAYVKQLGKKAVHLGGSTQILFGIKGKRWESNVNQELFNENWIYPLEEKPANFQKLDGGCYW